MRAGFVDRLDLDGSGDLAGADVDPSLWSSIREALTSAQLAMLAKLDAVRSMVQHYVHKVRMAALPTL